MYKSVLTLVLAFASSGLQMHDDDQRTLAMTSRQTEPMESVEAVQ